MDSYSKLKFKYDYIDDSIEDEFTIEDYNNEPVHYCTFCLSLGIKSLPDDTDYCIGCGSTDITTSSVGEWQILTNKK